MMKLLLTLSAVMTATAFHVQTSKNGMAPLNSYLGSLTNADTNQQIASQATSRVGARGSEKVVSSPRRVDDSKLVKNIWDTTSPVTVQGNSLRTWSFTTPAIERVAVFLKTEGRPLNADIDLWQGPDNTPQKMAIYVEDGSFRPFSAVIETPGGNNAVAIRNTGHMEFPLSSIVEAEVEDSSGVGSAGFKAVTTNLATKGKPRIVQGGAVYTLPFNPSVASVQVMLKTDGRPLNARVELLQGPNNNKQVMEIYTEDGSARPFFAVIETPGVGNVVRIVNTATVEFPLTATLEPYLVDEKSVQGADASGYFIVD